MNDKAFHFLPRDTTFWSYHWMCISLLVVVHLLLSNHFQRDFFVFNFLGFILWLPLFTLAVLYYRYLFKKKSWSQLAIDRQILVTFIYSFLAGFVITVVVLLSILPMFLGSLLMSESFYTLYQNDSYLNFVLKLVSINTLQSFVFMAIWIFIYKNFSANREVQQASLDRLQVENHLKDSKLQNLSNQLNPHLLFNTLNNIRSMIHKDPDKSEDMLTSLSEILRYALQGSAKEKVKLEEEWDIVTQLLEIAKMQFGKRIEYDIHYDAALGKYLLPPLAIQTLVENSIKHGLQEFEQGYLRIVVNEEKDKIRVYVENPLPPSGANRAKGTGTGLKNLRQRIELLYGDRADLNIVKNSSTHSVTIVLPKEYA